MKHGGPPEPRRPRPHSGRPWHSITFRTDAPRDGTEARARVGGDSPWFSGHFPGEPILPGIAQLAMVVEAARAGLNRPVTLSAIKRVRFRRIIEPDAPFTILVTPREENAPVYNFKIEVEGENACSGMLVLEHRGGEEPVKASDLK